MGQKLFRSGVCVRATHTLLTWAVTLSLFLHDTGELFKGIKRRQDI